jgi:RimJ/RimL family protein N-acetyltransferase
MLQKIEATVFAGNMASRRIFEKNGFSLEGTIRKAALKRGQLIDEWLLGIVR